MRVRIAGGQFASSQARVSARNALRSDMRYPPSSRPMLPNRHPRQVPGPGAPNGVKCRQTSDARQGPAREATMTIQHFDWIAHHASKHGDNLAMIDLHTNRAFSYAQFDDRVGRLASALRRQQGITRGDRVAVLAHNSSDLCEIQFACARLGAVFVPMNWRLTVPELTYIVGDCSPAVLMHDAEFEDAARQLAAVCDVAHLHPRASAYEPLIAGAANDVTPEPLTHDDTAALLYTSGTTGHPKGAVITHGMRFWQTVNLTGPERLTADSVCLVTLPQFHVGGLDVYANPCFHFGGKVLVMRGYDPASTLRLLSDP